MNKFMKLFKKVNGKEQLKQYARAHVLIFALFQTLILGLSKKSLEIVRLSANNKLYRRLVRKNKKYIAESKKKIDNIKTEKKHANIIWTIWLQGMDNAPDIVKCCYESMKRNIPDKEIIVITEDNYKDYVQFPQYIMDKYHKGIISKVHFADLLRLELLAKYGGTWMDGTVYCTEKISCQNYILNSDLFLFQTLKPGLDGECRAISSWLMTASAQNPIILLTRDLLHNYWVNHNSAVDYFILHDFFQMAIETYPEEWNKVVPFSNSTPHILLLRLFEKFDGNIWNAICQQTCFHKLSHKISQDNVALENTYYKHIMKLSH